MIRSVEKSKLAASLISQLFIKEYWFWSFGQPKDYPEEVLKFSP
jgi:hypothetical protein